VAQSGDRWALQGGATSPIEITEEQQLRWLIDAVADHAIFMVSPEGAVVSWNAGAERITGYSASEIVGQHIRLLHPVEERAAGLPEAMLRTASEHGRFDGEGWRVRKDGTRFWASVVLDPIVQQGRLVGFAKITRDVSRRKMAEQAASEQERRFRILVQAVTDYAIYMIDPLGVVTNWNAGAEHIKGYAANEIIGQHFALFYTAEDRAAGLPERMLETARREGKSESEGWRVRKDGTRFWANCVLDAIRDSAGELIGFAKITRDITERRVAAQELSEARERLFQAQKLEAMGQLAGGIAHDFNNLLTVITGSIELAERSIGAEEKPRRLLRSMRIAAERGASLTRQLLAFSRRQPLRPEVIRPGRRLQDIASLLARSLRGNLSIVTELRDDLWPIEVDASQLELALLNVGLNARDAMEHSGTLRIVARNAEVNNKTLELDGRYVVVSLSDNGTGISPENLPKVVEPFFTTKDVGKGTGLGLSQAYGFARQSRGALTVASELGRGTTVTLYLPATTDEAARQDESPGSQAPTGHGRILVVEDDRDVAALALALLEQCGYESRLVDDPRTALALVDGGESFDLVFSDIVMPGGMTGLDLARMLRERHPEMPVLLVTGYSSAAINPEAHGYPLLTKPYTLQELCDAVARQLQESRPAIGPATESPERPATAAVSAER
jgi:PAS domain S-box-containing protein